MSLNITHTMNSFQFENRENLRNAAKNILNNKNTSAEASQRIIEQAIFSTQKTFQNPQLSIIQASSQITLNDTLKETLKYLKSQANKKKEKEPVLGELWNLFSNEESHYEGELLEFEIDSTAKNIFAA